jgi:ankyrin repeat protein
MRLLTSNEKLTIYKKFDINKDASIGFPCNIDILVKLGISLDIPYGPKKETSLHVCCMYGKVYFFDKLMETDINIDLQNNENKTGIMIASQYGNVKIVEKLLEKNANFTYTDKINKNTAIMLACKNGHLSCVRHLFQNGANLNDIGENGYNCLLLSVESGNKDLVKYVIDKVDINFRTSMNGDTALIIATRKNNTEIVSLLLINNADKSIKENYKGCTAMDIAKENENIEIISLLENNKKRKRDKK